MKPDKKYLYILMAALAVCLFAQCKLHKKVKYNIPPTLQENDKRELLSRLEKGRVLYKENCSGCHGIFSKGQDGIPNFTNTQIDNYSKRFIYRDPKSHAVALKMHPEQFSEIIAFLQYRKIDGPPANQVNPAAPRLIR